MKRSARQGWYSPIPDKTDARTWTARFFTNFVEKIVSKDLDQDQSLWKQRTIYHCSIFRQVRTCAHQGFRPPWSRQVCTQIVENDVCKALNCGL